MDTIPRQVAGELRGRELATAGGEDDRAGRERRRVAQTGREVGHDALDVSDTASLRAAMNRAVERLNITRFTPVGRARELAVSALRQVVEALTEGDSQRASVILREVEPESRGTPSRPSPAASAGVTLGLLDGSLPATTTAGERAAIDILALARQGGEQVLSGARGPG